RQHPKTVRARLDREVANSAWVDRFLRYTVTHIAAYQSDHKMVILDMMQQRVLQRCRRTAQFYFDARWLQSEDCKKVIEAAWGNEVNGDAHLILWKKIQQYRIELLRWKRLEFDQPQQQIQLEEREMLRWQQRSKEHWLANGDGNTKYFHSRASARKWYNNISRLKDGDGRWQDTEEDIQEILLQHYRSIFASVRPSNATIVEVVSAIPCRVTPKMNALLSQPFTVAEVKQALFGMFPFKSLGPDGMSLVFFQKLWNIVGTDVSNSVLRILNEQAFLYRMNYTHVVLISKCDNPKVVSQLRPISLCNVIVKLASKCLANRLKGIMNSIISPSQSAFIPDRRVLLRLGFGKEFVELIMLLVTTVSYSLTLNGEPFGYFRPERGIRQGDPLSPYLFIFCAEAFSCLIQKAEERGVIQGIRVSLEAPSISHLLFADDTLLFCEAVERQMEEIRSIFALHANASGQEVNFSKSGMVISGTIRDKEKRRLASWLGVRLVGAHDQYLGLPAVAGRSRRALFHNIRDRFWGRINGWNSKLLSQAGKGVLIKSLLQSLPTGDKKGWRVISQPASLLSQVLKPRYFPRCSFWEATVGSRPSLTWRSVLLARGVLRVGCVEHSTPINPGGERVIWKPSKKGLFSVRSAYKVALELDARVSASSSRSFPFLTEGYEKFWQQMWALVVPPRVRVQVWRFCPDAIPTMDNLAKRHRVVDTRCIRCEAVEMIKHVLWECHFPRMVWHC
ncbi:UNVERIFIED_CONTAM: putative mitochondrial protein, partial [Sesamum latifolium]